MSDSDRNYYRRRALEELEAAIQASCVEAATAHKLLAERFSELADPAEDQIPLNGQSSAPSL
jgi:hypothetical protein